MDENAKDIYRGITKDNEDETDCDDSVFHIDLKVTGDEGSGYRTKNDPRPGHQWHRDDITQRKGPMSIKCNMTDVIHGKWSTDSEEYATLVVFLFRFDATNNSRRISRVDMTIDFYGQDEDDPYSQPEVYAISFDDALSLVEKTQSESITKEVSGTTGLTAAQIAELSGSLKWQKTVAQDVKSYTRVIGNTYKNKFDFRPDAQVNWILLENGEFGTGVPVAFRAGILLKREDQSPFKCEVKIKVKADVRSLMETFFGDFKTKDDLVLFNPLAKVTPRKLQAVKQDTVDLDNLGSFNLESVSKVTFMRIHDGAVERKVM